MADVTDYPAPVPLAVLMRENPEAFKFDDIKPDPADRDPDAEAPIQRVLGTYMPIAGRPGWYTRELTLRQEILLSDRAAEYTDLAGKTPVEVVKLILPLLAMILHRRKGDDEIVQCSEDDILDNFRSSDLLEIVRDVTGLVQGAGADAASPTSALPITD